MYFNLSFLNTHVWYDLNVIPLLSVLCVAITVPGVQTFILYDFPDLLRITLVQITQQNCGKSTTTFPDYMDIKKVPGQRIFIFPSWHLLMYSILYSGRHIATSKNPTRYPNKRLTHKPTITKIPPIRFRRENTCERTISINMPVNTCPTNKNSDR